MATTIPPPALAAPPNAIASAPVVPPSSPVIAKVRMPAARRPGSSSRVRQPRSSPIKSPMPSATAKREIRSRTSMGNPARAQIVQPQRLKPIHDRRQSPDWLGEAKEPWMRLLEPAAAAVAADVTGDPSQNVGVDVARFPHRSPIAERYRWQPQARPRKDGRGFDRRKQRLQAGGDRSLGRRGHEALPSLGRDVFDNFPRLRVDHADNAAGR